MTRVRLWLQIIMGIGGMGSGLFLDDVVICYFGAILLLLFSYEVMIGQSR